MDPLEIAPLIKADEKRRPRKGIPKVKKEYKWKAYRLGGLSLTLLAGLLRVIRVLIDGRVSFYATVLKLLSLVLTGITIALDPGIETWDAKFSYASPKLFGFITSVITLIGIIVNDETFYNKI